MLAAHFKLLLMCVPRNLKELVRVIGLPFISMGVLRKVNNEFLGLGCVELELFVRTPIYSLVQYYVVLGFIIVWDEAFNGCVIRILCFHWSFHGCKVCFVKGKEPRGENTALRSSFTEVKRVWAYVF